MRNASFDLPANLSPSDPNFIAILNDRLRRISAASNDVAPTATAAAAATSSTIGGRLNVLEFIPQVLHASINARTITVSVASYIQDAIDKARSVRKRNTLYFPGGLYPLLGDGVTVTDNLTLLGDGGPNSVLTYTGNGVALTFGDDTALRLHTGATEMGVKLVGAGNDAICIKSISCLFNALDRVEMTTDAPYTSFADTTYHTNYNQTGLLLHGGTWGSLRGLVSITGTALVSLYGDPFGPWFVHGSSITIGGVSYLVDVYTDPTHLTLQSAPGDSAEAEYSSTTHGFGAFFSWKDCAVRGLFKRGIVGDGAENWGFDASIFTGGGSIWTGTPSAPAGFGYYGLHAINLVASVHELDVENWEVCNELLSPCDLVISRNEGYRTAAVRLRAAGPPNCTIAGSHTYAVLAIGDQVDIHNSGLAGIVTAANVGDAVIIEKAAAHYGDLTTTIASVQSDTHFTLATPTTYFALHGSLGAGGTRFFSGSAFSTLGGRTMIDETDGSYGAFASEIPELFEKNRMLGTTACMSSIDMKTNSPLIFEKTGGSSGLFWKSGDYGPIFSQGVADVTAGVVVRDSGDFYSPTVYKAGVKVFINNLIRTIGSWQSTSQFTLTILTDTLIAADILLSPLEASILAVGSSLHLTAGIRDKIFTNIVSLCAGNGNHEFRGETTMGEPDGALRLKLDSGIISAYLGITIVNNTGIAWATLGGSSGLFWFDGPDLDSEIVDTGGGLTILSGRAGHSRDINISTVGGGVVKVNIDGVTVLEVTNAGVYCPTIAGAATTPVKVDSAGQLGAGLIDLTSVFDVVGPLPISLGGTGAITAAAARTALGVAATTDSYTKAASDARYYTIAAADAAIAAAVAAQAVIDAANLATEATARAAQDASLAAVEASDITAVDADLTSIHSELGGMTHP